MQSEKIPLRGQLLFAAGTLGWSVVVNLLAGLIIYFYQPVGDDALQNLIPKITIIGFINALSLIVMSARLIDALVDPFIAHVSDRSEHKRGRRIPLMRRSLIPVLITGILLYMPLTRYESFGNIWWLAGIMIAFNVAISFYVIPYNALLPELGYNSEVKLRISTFQSIAYTLGLVVASASNALLNFYQDYLHIEDKFRAFQFAIWTIFVVGWIFLLLPVLINEKKYIQPNPVTKSINENFRTVLRNKNVLLYLIADFTYFISLTIIGTGALYYVKALLHLEEKHGTGMVATTVGLAMLLSPLVYYMANRYSKKMMILVSLIFLSLVFSSVRYLGDFGIDNVYQAYILAAVLSLPFSVLGILPPVVLAELTQVDAHETKENREATFFAIRSLFIQLGQTLGIVTFTILIGLDPDKGLGKYLAHVFHNIPFEELGIRLSGIFGFALCLIAAIIFAFFNEKKLKAGIRAMEDDQQKSAAELENEKNAPVE